MNRVYNFSAGPSMLPLSVLETAQKELLNYAGSGMSVMELSHRSQLFTDIIEQAEELLRDLLQIPENYKVLFLQGGATQQFSMVPLNLMKRGKAAYIDTGSWSKKAIAEAKKFGDVDVIASSADRNYSYIPALDNLRLNDSYDYVHITSNNTIEGTAYSEFPETGDIPLVADMSSNILSEEIDVSQFGIIYAGAQKNIGPAGLTIVIIREDLIGGAKETCPIMLDYEVHSEKASLYNTPPTFAIYMAKLVFEWIRDLGGLKTIEKVNREKADVLYSYLDRSELFISPVEKGSRSLMNIPFFTRKEELDQDFIRQAKEAQLESLKGHRSIGGMRASIYNGMPLEGVQKLVEKMQEFETKIIAHA